MDKVILSVFNTKDYYNCLSLIEPCHEKSAFLKNKGADQPHDGNYAAYQLRCLRYIDSTISVLQKTKFPASRHLENQSVNTRAGGGGGSSKLAFDIINDHLYNLVC